MIIMLHAMFNAHDETQTNINYDNTNLIYHDNILKLLSRHAG